MARQKFSHRLPETRITEQLYRKMHQTANDNEAKLTDLIRAALEQFFADDIDTEAGGIDSFAVPVVGTLTNKGFSFNVPRAGAKKILAHYLEVEPVGGA